MFEGKKNAPRSTQRYFVFDLEDFFMNLRLNLFNFLLLKN